MNGNASFEISKKNLKQHWKNAGLFQPKIGSNMDKPKFELKMEFKMCSWKWKLG